MSLYRNRYFFAGVLLILLGVQFRRVESFVLNEPTTRFVARVTNTPIADTSSPLGTLFEPVTPKPRKRVRPPRWLGLSMIAIGGVVSLHALVIPKHKD
jgi:hypothetical protein